MPRPNPSVVQREARLERREAALALRDSMSPAGPAPGRLRIASWNLNSLRRRLPAVERFLLRAAPDVLCLQETKATSLSTEARTALERLGYGVEHVGASAYNGVAVASRHPIEEVVASGGFGDEHLDREPRLLTCLVRTPEPVRVACAYVPHGREVGHWHYDYKLGFLGSLATLAARWLELADASVVVAGDLNVAATDSDVFHPDAFRGSTHVTAPERTALQQLFQVGLVDVDVARWGPDARRFTWWNHGIGYPKNLGMRLDVIAADRSLADRLDTTWIDHVERSAEGPSDHAALIADFEARLPEPDSR